MIQTREMTEAQRDTLAAAGIPVAVPLFRWECECGEVGRWHRTTAEVDRYASRHAARVHGSTR